MNESFPAQSDSLENFSHTLDVFVDKENALLDSMREQAHSESAKTPYVQMYELTTRIAAEIAKEKFDTGNNL